MEKESKKQKERYWAFIMYEDSRPKNWKEILEDQMIEIAISPRHDRDMEEDGTLKKPHYHVMIIFNGPTTYNRALEISNLVNGTIPKRILSVKGMYDYLTHKNNEDKAKYREEDIVCLNGFEIKDFGYTNSEIEAMKREIIEIIRNEKIMDFAYLYDSLTDMGMNKLCEILSKNVVFFNAYLKSKKYLAYETQEML